MLLRDKGENVGAKIEIGSKKKKTGPKETLGTYSFDSTSVLAFFFLVEAGLNHLLPEVLPDFAPKKFLFLSVAAGFIVSFSYSNSLPRSYI